MNEIENRIDKIEMKLSFLEDFLMKIQDVTVEQSKQIEILKKENRILSEKMHDICDNLEGDIPNRKPPHY